MDYSYTDISPNPLPSSSGNPEFRALVENTPDLILQVTPDLKISYANTRLIHELGILPADIVGNVLAKVDLPETVIDCWQAAIEQVLSSHQEQDIEFDLPTRSGAFFWYARVVPQFDLAGTLTSVLVISRDVTRLKMAELALRQSENRYRAIIEDQVELVCRFTPDGSLSFVNDACCRFWGRDRPSLIHTSILQWVLPIDHPQLEQRLANLKYRLTDRETMEIRVISLTGEIYWMQWNIKAILNDQDDLVECQSVGRDIQDRKLMESALRQRVERERTFNRVVQVIRHSLDLTTVFSTATAEIAKLLQVDRVAIFQYLAETGVWIGVADHCPDPALTSVLHLQIADHSAPLFDRLKQAEIVCITDTTMMQSLTSVVFAAELPGAWLLVPLIVGNKVWGALSINQCPQPRHWKDAEVELACIVADQLAIAIQQSQLYGQVQHLNASLERQVRVRTAQLQLAYDFEATLKRITDRVRDSLDEDQILQTAVEELAQGMGLLCCNAAIFDLERGTSTIRYESTTNLPPSQGRTSRLQDFPELYGPLMQGHYFQFCSILPNPVREPMAVLACPIQDNQGVLGDLWLISSSYHAYSEPDIRLVQQVANQCAIAIRQARLYQTSQAQVTDLERLNSLKDDFLSTVSHELRTPMSNVKMAARMLDLMLTHAGILTPETRQDHPEIDRYFHILHDECQREINLINDLLDLSRLDAGSDPPNLTTINLSDWLPQIVVAFDERAQAQQQTFEFRLAPNLPALITDPSYLERILSELLNNACKYTPPGQRIWLEAQAIPLSTPFPPSALQPQIGDSAPALLCSVAQPCWLFQIIVTNTGVEIPEAERDRIFEKFYRIPKSDPWRHGGTGLGLALIKKLVEQLGGCLRVESNPLQTQMILEFTQHMGNTPDRPTIPIENTPRLEPHPTPQSLL